MSIYSAFLTASGELKSYVLTHDVKKAIASQTGLGLAHIVSKGATTAVVLSEPDPEILSGLQKTIFSFFQSQVKPAKPRRSALSGPAYHQMAISLGLQICVPFENGKLLTSPFQEIMALDFEPKPGRREFLITLITSPKEGKG